MATDSGGALGRAPLSSSGATCQQACGLQVAGAPSRPAGFDLTSSTTSAMGISHSLRGSVSSSHEREDPLRWNHPSVLTQALPAHVQALGPSGCRRSCCVSAPSRASPRPKSAEKHDGGHRAAQQPTAPGSVLVLQHHVPSAPINMATSLSTKNASSTKQQSALSTLASQQTRDSCKQKRGRSNCSLVATIRHTVRECRAQHLAGVGF